MRRICLFLLLCFSGPVVAEESTGVPTEVLRKALDWMKSPDPARRRAAYSTMQLLEEGDLGKFQTALLDHFSKVYSSIEFF